MHLPRSGKSSLYTSRSDPGVSVRGGIACDASARLVHEGQGQTLGTCGAGGRLLKLSADTLITCIMLALMLQIK